MRIRVATTPEVVGHPGAADVKNAAAPQDVTLPQVTAPAALRGDGRGRHL
jgi:hypothetical protein